MDQQPSAAAPTDYSPICTVSATLMAIMPSIVDQVQDASGLTNRNVVSKLKDCVDGTSNTIMLAESAGRPFVYRNGQKIGGLPNDRVNGGGWARAASDMDLYGSSADGITLNDGMQPVPGLCGINCTNGGDLAVIGSIYPYRNPYVGNGTGQPYAFHSDGANFLFGDGSSHFFRPGSISACLPGL